MARVSSPYGPRVLFGRTFHHGVDYAVPIGTPIYANKKLTVSKAQYVRGYGNVIYARDDAGTEYRFGHLDSIPANIKPGQVINPGEKIANSGNTGDSTGAHLHYEVRKNGVSVDPLARVDTDPNSPVTGKTYDHVATFSPNGASMTQSSPSTDLAYKPNGSSGAQVLDSNGQPVTPSSGQQTTVGSVASANSQNRTGGNNSLTKIESSINPLLELGA